MGLTLGLTLGFMGLTLDLTLGFMGLTLGLPLRVYGFNFRDNWNSQIISSEQILSL
jgi:hypothetical protein